MRKRNNAASEGACPAWAILLAVMCCSAMAAYALFSPLFAASSSSDNYASLSSGWGGESSRSRDSCCRGVKNLELWGHVVMQGDKRPVNTSEECCKRCKGVRGCNSWVFCGDEAQCGERLGQCWLKKQDDPLKPDVQASGNNVMWTSGLIYDKDVGIIGIDTNQGVIRMELLVDCAPYSVSYLLEVLKIRHCAGCHIYRAEGRGSSWNERGDKIGQINDGPYALIQGALAVQTFAFDELPIEACPIVKRGSVGWIGGGPDFFISLANHDEWYPKQTVFAEVLKEDMHIVEKIANLPTVLSNWSGVNVAVLEETIPVKIVRTGSSKVASG